MRLDRWLAPFALVLALCLVTEAASGQGATPAEVEEALEDLSKAPPYERSEARAELVSLGDIAVDSLVSVVEGSADAADANYVVHCIIALGELKAERATDALLAALGSRNYHQVYAAAGALGEIWEGKGGSGDEKVKAVNAALLALLYADMPDVAVFGPGRALARINAIPAIDRPANMTADALKNALSAWAGANPNALPALSDQPWQLGVRIALTASDATVRADALQAVRQKRELGALKPLLDALAQNTTLSAEARGDVGGLVGDLSTVAFPVPGTQNEGPGAQVQEWQRAWLAHLKGPDARDAKHVQCSWSELEAALRRYKEAPTDAKADSVKYFRAALLSQLDGADQIPASASPAVKDLLEKPLAAKAEIAKAVAAAEAAAGDPDATYEMARQLRIVKQELEDDLALEVGRMYAGRLATVAYTEKNARTADMIGEILSRLSGVPVELELADIEARQRSLKRWVDEYNKRYAPPITLPE